jgi:hypothetical protein
MFSAAFADHPTGGNDLWKDLSRHSEEGEEFRIPRHTVECVEHGPGGVRVVSHVAAPGEPSHDPAVDRPSAKFPGSGSLPETIISQQPLELCGGEIRIEQQTGPFPDPILPPLSAKLLTSGCGTTVLPHHRPVHGSKRVTLPYHDRLALIGDPNCGRLFSGRGNGLVRRSDGGRKQFLGVVLDPPWFREMLGNFTIAATQHGSVLVDHQGRRSCCPLVECEDG